jgi:FtsH-binding integral membrane protein
MPQTIPYQQMGTAARGEAHELFAQTMGYVAVTAAPMLAASIFLDILNVFLFFLEIFSGEKR